MCCHPERHYSLPSCCVGLLGEFISQDDAFPADHEKPVELFRKGRRIAYGSVQGRVGT